MEEYEPWGSDYYVIRDDFHTVGTAATDDAAGTDDGTVAPSDDAAATDDHSGHDHGDGDHGDGDHDDHDGHDHGDGDHGEGDHGDGDKDESDGATGWTVFAAGAVAAVLAVVAF